MLHEKVLQYLASGGELHVAGVSAAGPVCGSMTRMVAGLEKSPGFEAILSRIPHGFVQTPLGTVLD